MYQKADHTIEHMGLTTWKNCPDGRILKSDVMISRKQAEEKAENEYIKFNKNKEITSDFDRLLLEANRLNNKK